jgi:hypothetical protein
MSDLDDARKEEGTLRWIRSPVEWTAFDEDGSVLRLFFVQAGSASGPGGAIAEVVLSEGPDQVAITLFERVLGGVHPDGSIAARSLAAVGGCLEIELDRPLAGRKLLDGATGLTPHKRDRDAREPEEDWFHARALAHGCPRWMP